MIQPKVSFIIPHKGRENLLIETLQAIAALDYNPAALQVILVTQNDNLSDNILSLQRQLALEVYHQSPAKTISALRNFGVSRAGGMYYAFLDADVALSRNWLKAMLQALRERDNTVLVSAVQENGQKPPPLERVRTALSNIDIDAYVDFLPGRNLFMHRDTFKTVGGFPEHLVTCEDYYFTDQVNRLGRLFYCSDASYVHLGEDKDYGEMFKKEIWRGQSNLQSISGRRVPARELPSFIVPVAVLVLLLAALVLGVLGQFGPAVISLLLSQLPAVAYSLRLKRKTGSDVALWPIMQFYLLYFPARGIGTVMGIFKSMTSMDHR